jgi:hypothetical protein
MSTHAGSAPNAGITKERSCREVVRFKSVVAIGASGAASQAACVQNDCGYDDPAFTCTKNGTGTYDLTFPKGKRAFVNLALYSPSLTVVTWAITALSASAGTATVKTLAGTNAAAATEPASGNILYFDIEVVP